MPDLQIRTVELDPYGLWNDVVIVNRELVFRFAKSDRGQDVLAQEARLLGILHGHISLAIPQPSYVGTDVLVYPYLMGQPLTRSALVKIESCDRERIAEQLGQFLRELHSVPVDDEMPTTMAPVTAEAWRSIADQVRELVYPLLLPHQVHWADDLLEEALGASDFFSYDPALIQGDLAPHHILFRKSPVRINAILDFGVAGTGDPASDIAMLMQAYGESLTDLVLEHYAEGKNHLKRARFYAQAIELWWAMQGVRTGEKLWFTAHIGGARDIRM